MSEAQKPAAVPAVPAVPDYLKKMQGTAVSTGAVDSLASAAMSIPRISMRSKKFRFMEGGQEIATENDSIEVIIVGVEPEAGRFIKTFYAQPYGGANQNNPPDCSSDDGIRPSGWITNPVNPTCAECPKNRFGSALSRTGKPSKACRDSKRLWVSRRKDVEEAKEGQKPTLYALGVPVTSLRALSDFGRDMKGLNVPMASAVVKITMDDDTEFPQISFVTSAWLAEDKAKMCIERGEKQEWTLQKLTRPALPAGQVPNLALPGQPASTQPAASTAPSQPAAAPGVTAGAAPAAEAKPAPDMNDVVNKW